MRRKIQREPDDGNQDSFQRKAGLTKLPAAAALSFLKETKGILTWTVGDLSRTLQLNKHEAEQIIALLAMQGYIKQLGPDEWVTTIAGEDVSGAKSPRFSPQSVQQALSELQARIREINGRSQGPYKISEAVAFGDFLGEGARVQAADVGIRLVSRKVKNSNKKRAERAFLKELRAKSMMLNIKPYEAWMSTRKHRSLVSPA